MRSIKVKLMFPVLIMFIVFTGFLMQQSSSASNNLNKVMEIEQKSFATVNAANHLKFCVVQVQQWLTDISATRGAKGYDDGYTEAENYAKEVDKTLDTLASINPSQKSQIDEIRTQFNAYYTNGKAMAAAYIAGGPESGNQMMDSFDQVAEDINSSVDKFQVGANDKLQKDILEIQTSTSYTLMMSKIAIGIGVFIAILSLLFIIRVILRPIMLVVREAEVIASGNLQNKNESLQKYLRSKDEIGKLIRAFEVMKKNLREILLGVQDLSSNVAVLSEDMAQSAKSSGAVAKQIAESTNTMAENAVTQNIQVTNIKHIVEASVDRTNEGFKKANDMIEVATVSTDIATTGRDKIKEVIEQYEWIIKTVEFATESIQYLGKKSAEIGQFVETIKGISVQTNLLSLNAAIEAAKSGQEGKGFAVVAGEIRILAERTSLAAKTISDLINRTQAETAETISAMEGNLENVSLQLNAVKNGEEALETIVMKVKENENLASDIYKIYEQISHMSDNINQSVTDITQSVSSNAAYSEEVATSSEEQSTLMEEVMEKTVELANIAEYLKKEISKFKI